MGNSRILRTLTGLQQIQYQYYRCTNPQCRFNRKPFRLTHDQVIKRKHFAKDVWEKIVEDFMENTVNASKEARLLQSHHPLVQISQRSVLRIWTTYLALASNIADKKALAKVKAQGYILLALDGQRPEAGHKSLWYFLDVGTDQVLHTAYLDVADSPTLKTHSERNSNEIPGSDQGSCIRSSEFHY